MKEYATPAPMAQGLYRDIEPIHTRALDNQARAFMEAAVKQSQGIGNNMSTIAIAKRADRCIHHLKETTESLENAGLIQLNGLYPGWPLVVISNAGFAAVREDA